MSRFSERLHIRLTSEDRRRLAVLRRLTNAGSSELVRKSVEFFALLWTHSKHARVVLRQEREKRQYELYLGTPHSEQQIPEHDASDLADHDVFTLNARVEARDIRKIEDLVLEGVGSNQSAIVRQALAVLLHVVQRVNEGWIVGSLGEGFLELPIPQLTGRRRLPIDPVQPNFAALSARTVKNAPGSVSGDAVRSLPVMNRCSHEPVTIGDRLRGRSALYEIAGCLGTSISSATYVASVVDTNGASLSVGDKVVVKVPLLKADVGDYANTQRLSNLFQLFSSERASLLRLSNLDCVARFLDIGLFDYQLHSGSAEALFMVQQFIPGKNLRMYCDERYRDLAKGAFVGLDETEFFNWARRLALCVHEIHSRLVVHADLRPENIMVDSAGQLTIVDFGQAVLVEVVSEPAELAERNGSYQAPERERSVSGDLYSLGGILFYLATGTDPVGQACSAQETVHAEELKVQVSGEISRRNPKLMESNCGVADIIARCRRLSGERRVPHADALIQDLDLFENNASEVPSGALEAHCNRISGLITGFERTPLVFQSMAYGLISEFTRALEGMRRGVYDVMGGHDEIVLALAKYVSTLGPDDEYLTLSVPQFWWPANVGLNGRFHSVNQLAVRRGATIRRVFVIGAGEERTDPHVSEIVEWQRRAVSSMRNARGQLETGFVRVEIAEREEFVREGGHFGLIVQNGVPLAIFPLYREDRQLVGVRFRAGQDLVGGIREKFEEYAHRSVPIEHWTVGNESMVPLKPKEASRLVLKVAHSRIPRESDQQTLEARQRTARYRPN